MSASEELQRSLFTRSPKDGRSGGDGDGAKDLVNSFVKQLRCLSGQHESHEVIAENIQLPEIFLLRDLTFSGQEVSGVIGHK